MFKGTEALGLMQSRAGVTAESLVEIKEALKLVMNESAGGESYAAEEVQVNAHADSSFSWETWCGGGHVQYYRDFCPVLFRVANTARCGVSARFHLFVSRLVSSTHLRADMQCIASTLHIGEFSWRMATSKYLPSPWMVRGVWFFPNVREGVSDNHTFLATPGP